MATVGRSSPERVTHQGRRNERGQNLIEFALLFPLLLFLVLGIIDFSLLFFSYNTLANVAREGARYGIIDDNKSNIENAGRALATGLDPARLTLNNTTIWDCDEAGPYGAVGSVTVRALYDYPMITGTFLTGGGSGTIQLRTVTSMKCEQ